MENTCDTRQLLFRRAFVVAACRVAAVAVFFHAVISTLYMDLFEYIHELVQRNTGFVSLADISAIMLKALFSGMAWALVLWLTPKYMMRFFFPLGKGSPS